MVAERLDVLGEQYQIIKALNFNQFVAMVEAGRIKLDDAFFAKANELALKENAIAEST